MTASFGRVSMHGVRESLLDRQVEELALPCTKISSPSPCTNEVYEAEMRRVLVQAREQGVTHVVFGDLFLRDIREYREARLAEVGMQGVFPLWLGDTPAVGERVPGGGEATSACPPAADRWTHRRPNENVPWRATRTTSSPRKSVDGARRSPSAPRFSSSRSPQRSWTTPRRMT